MPKRLPNSESPIVQRFLFTLCSLLSLLLCVAVCVLWWARVERRRVGDGWFIFGGRYTLSLAPDQMAVLGPTRWPNDPAVRKRVKDIAEAMRADATLRYHGTTGAMGFGCPDFGPALTPFLGSFKTLTDATLYDSLDNAPIPMLLGALEDDRQFLLAHALLNLTDAGDKVSHYNPTELKWSLEPTGAEGNWIGEYDGVRIRVAEDRPRRDAGSWLDEIWGVMTMADPASGERAQVRRLWHERFDVPRWTARYWQLALATLVFPATQVVATLAGRRRRRTRRAAGRCPACGYDLRATPGRCPESGNVTEATMNHHHQVLAAAKVGSPDPFVGYLYAPISQRVTTPSSVAVTNNLLLTNSAEPTALQEWWLAPFPALGTFSSPGTFFSPVFAGASWSVYPLTDLMSEVY